MRTSLKAAAEGRFKVLVDRVLPLSEAVQAHEIVAARSGIGTALLDPRRT